MDKLQKLIDAMNERVEKAQTELNEADRLYDLAKNNDWDEEQEYRYENALDARSTFLRAEAERNWVLSIIN